MTRFALATAALALTVSLAHAQPKEPYTPGLGEIMTLQQMRHLKLWFAGQAGNWALADYELDELKEGYEDIVKYFPTKDEAPTGVMATAVIEREVADLNKAIAAKNAGQFVAAFDRLTNSCNACHQSSKKPFIVIQRPAANPYANQSFTPSRK